MKAQRQRPKTGEFALAVLLATAPLAISGCLSVVSPSSGQNGQQDDGDGGGDDGSGSGGDSGPPACTLGSTFTMPLTYQANATTSSIGNGFFTFGTTTTYMLGNDDPSGAGTNGLANIMRTTDRGETWTSIHTYQYASGKPTYYWDMAKDSSGNLFVAAQAVDAGDKYHWLVRKSTDGGTTWTTVDDYQLATGEDSHIGSITIAPNGHLYAAGIATDGTAGDHWMGYHTRHVVRKSADGGATWTTVDNFSYEAAPFSHYGGLVTSTSNGNVYAFSVANSTGGLKRFVVRRSTNAGATWTTVDSYNHNSSEDGYAYRLKADSSGTVYAVGYAGWTSGGNKNAALIRKSSDGGATWSTFLDYQLVANRTALGNDIAFASNGDIYVAAEANNASNLTHWMTLKYTAGTSSWSVVDQYVSAYTYATSWGVAFNWYGDLLTVGYALGADGYNRWIMRKLACE